MTGAMHRSEMKISFELGDDHSKELKRLAAEYGLAPSDLAQAVLAEWLNKPAGEFEQHLRYVLGKNKDLYDRLS